MRDEVVPRIESVSCRTTTSTLMTSGLYQKKQNHHRHHLAILVPAIPKLLTAAKVATRMAPCVKALDPKLPFFGP